MTNQVNNQRHKYHPLTAQYHNDSEDDDRLGCRNVSHCHQQFFSELHSPGRSHYTNSSIRRAKKFCNMRHYKHNSRVSQQGRKICILWFNTSQEHVNEDLTLSLAWLHCLKPKCKQLRTTYAISWHPACGVVLSKDLSRSFCKFSWSWRRKYTYWKPIVSGWKWFSEAGSSFATSNLHEFPRKLVIFAICQKLA